MNRLSVQQADYLFGCALAAFAVGLGLIFYDVPLDWGGDSALYLMHARNLVDDLPYAATGYIQNPAAYLAPTAYPPGYPLAIAPVYALFGLDIGAFRAATILIYGLALLAFITLTHRIFGDTRVDRLCWLAMIALVALNPAIVAYAAALGSDGLFLLLTIAALHLLGQLYRRYESGSETRLTALLLVPLTGLVVGAATLTRVFGLILIASIPIYELLRYRRLTWRGLLTTGIAAFSHGAGQALIRPSGSGGNGGFEGKGYWYLVETGILNRLAGIPPTAVENLAVYAGGLRYYLIPDVPLSVAAVLMLLIAAAAVLGYVLRLRTRCSPAEIFCALYFFSLLPWMAHSPRYLLPVVPFFFLYSSLGLRKLIASRVRKVAVLGVTLSSLCLITLTLAYVARYAERIGEFKADAIVGPSEPGARDMFGYIRCRTPENAIIVFRKPRILALFTHRYSATYADALNRTPSDEAILSLMDRVGADYVLSGPVIDSGRFDAFIARHPERLRKVYKNSDFDLYAVEERVP